MLFLFVIGILLFHIKIVSLISLISRGFFLGEYISSALSSHPEIFGSGTSEIGQVSLWKLRIIKEYPAFIASKNQPRICTPRINKFKDQLISLSDSVEFPPLDINNTFLKNMSPEQLSILAKK